MRGPMQCAWTILRGGVIIGDVRRCSSDVAARRGGADGAGARATAAARAELEVAAAAAAAEEKAEDARCQPRGEFVVEPKRSSSPLRGPRHGPRHMPPRTASAVYFSHTTITPC